MLLGHEANLKGNLAREYLFLIDFEEEDDWS